MPAGYNALLTKVTLDDTFGKTTQALNVAFNNIAETAVFLEGTDDAALEALGYAPTDVANLRSAYGDLEQLRRIYEGLEALAQEKDFTVFARRIWGTGFAGGF